MKTTGIENWFHLTVIGIFLIIHVDANKQKRQIFREQVLPALGGKIPEEAFRTDRLALNRLNKEGITVPDGVVLDARNVHKHSSHIPTIPEIIKVYLTPDGRYVPPEGRIHYNHAKTADTTYIIRTPYTKSNNRQKNANNFITKTRQNLPKSQTYASFRQFVPIIPPLKPGVYEPIVTPLILPGNTDLLEDPYVPSWNIRYDWDTVYEPLDDYFVNNIALLNSHQIINDYQGFLNNFRERSSRHIESYSVNRIQNPALQFRKQNPRGTNPNSQATSYQNIKLNAGNANSRYPNLTKIPHISFTCNGRKGMYADIETKCQVFHDCSGWSMTSSLCPTGTAFSEVNKRCEWWNTVQCK